MLSRVLSLHRGSMCKQLHHIEHFDINIMNIGLGFELSSVQKEGHISEPISFKTSAVYPTHRFADFNAFCRKSCRFMSY